MPVAALRHGWLALALVTFVITFNLFAASQQWNATLTIPLPVSVEWDELTPIRASLYGAFLTPIGLALIALLGRDHARAYGSAGWSQRFPLHVPGVSPAGSGGKRLARVAIMLFVVLPCYATAHFGRKLMVYGTLCLNGQLSDETLWSRNWGDTRIFDNSFRLGTVGAACDGGPTFQPFLEPLLIALAILYAIILLLLWAVAVLGKPRHA